MIKLWNIQFNQVEELLWYRLTNEDKALWDKFHSQKADLSDKDTCFHAFVIPTCIVVKWGEAIQAIRTMFTPEKIVNSVWTFPVYPI